MCLQFWNANLVSIFSISLNLLDLVIYVFWQVTISVSQKYFDLFLLTTDFWMVSLLPSLYMRQSVLSLTETTRFHVVHFQCSLWGIISYNNYLNKCKIQLSVGFYSFSPWWTIVIVPFLLERYFIAFSSSSGKFYPVFQNLMLMIM